MLKSPVISLLLTLVILFSSALASCAAIPGKDAVTQHFFEAARRGFEEIRTIKAHDPRSIELLANLIESLRQVAFPIATRPLAKDLFICLEKSKFSLVMRDYKAGSTWFKEGIKVFQRLEEFSLNGTEPCNHAVVSFDCSAREIQMLIGTRMGDPRLLQRLQRLIDMLEKLPVEKDYEEMARLMIQLFRKAARLIEKREVSMIRDAFKAGTDMFITIYKAQFEKSPWT